MHSGVTNNTRFFLLLILVAAIFSIAHTATAQVALGDEFIVFVEGKNVLVPEFDGTVINDPIDPANKVARFGYSGWAAPGFRWNGATGADMSQMVSPTTEGGKTLYLKLLVDPANFAESRNCPAPGFDPCLTITLFDATNGGNAGDDLEGRLKWPVPQELMDGAWHELAIPLPPNSFEALEAAKLGQNVDGSPLATPLDPNAALWSYTGGWANGWGWGGTNGVVDGPTDPNWQDYQWDTVRGITVHWDWYEGNVGGGGDVLIDDIYIGDATTNINDAINPPAAMAGATFAANGQVNTVSWTHNPDFGGYRVYLDTEPITTARLDAGEIPLLKELAFNAESFLFDHRYEVPHPSMTGMEFHYAVTSINLFGVENTDVSASSGMVENPNLAIQPFIVEVTNDQSDVIVGNLISDIVSSDGFPAGMAPFTIDSEHSSAGDLGFLADSDEDLSAKVWFGFNRQWNELYLYVEVTDDVVARHPGTSEDGCEGGSSGCGTWAYDSFEMGWTNYDVRDVAGGSILGGSPHENFERGDAADSQFRFAWLRANNPSTGVDASAFISPITGGDDRNQEIAASKTIYADLMDGANVVGYRFLSAFSLASIAISGTGDAITTLPDEDKIKLMALNFGINDGDDDTVTTGSRDVQIQWSIKPTASGSWWNTPAQWMTVAMAGINAPTGGTGVANEDVADLPMEFVLEQNYPNPFNPTTNIEFALPVTENVTLSVYNVLGQRVATLLENEQMATGRHTLKFDARALSSGVYLYRIDAGTSYTKTRSMLLLK